ncbi:hypothetical protein QJ847_03880 [Staphylococcus hominis]|uniref:hypothetical protein n=1 Tax=Staphylococcus hominis TaxID=1290 RepID=UPI0034CF1CAA
MTEVCKIKLYELDNEQIDNKYFNLLDYPIVYSSIDKVNKIENLRKDKYIYPFSLKQKNLKNMIIDNFESIVSISSDDEYFDDRLSNLKNDVNEFLDIINEMEEQEVEIEEVKVDLNLETYKFSKDGVIVINAPKKELTKKLFGKTIVKKVIGLI